MAKKTLTIPASAADSKLPRNSNLGSCIAANTSNYSAANEHLSTVHENCSAVTVAPTKATVSYLLYLLLDFGFDIDSRGSLMQIIIKNSFMMDEERI